MSTLLRTYSPHIFALLIASFVMLFAGVAYAQSGTTFENPLRSDIGTVPRFIEASLRVMVMVALPIISLAIVVSGFMFVMARGNTGQLQKARDNFLYVIIGSILILGAWVLATLLAGTVAELLAG